MEDKKEYKNVSYVELGEDEIEYEEFKEEDHQFLEGENEN